MQCYYHLLTTMLYHFIPQDPALIFTFTWIPVMAQQRYSATNQMDAFLSAVRTLRFSLYWVGICQGCAGHSAAGLLGRGRNASADVHLQVPLFLGICQCLCAQTLACTGKRIFAKMCMRVSH